MVGSRSKEGESPSEAQDQACEKPTSRASLSHVASLSRLPHDKLASQLLSCSEKNLGNLVRCLLAAGASANTRAPELRAPALCLAVQAGAEKSVKALLAGGADVAAAGAFPRFSQAWRSAHATPSRQTWTTAQRSTTRP